ncbi:MAG: hypothetical protein NTU45_15975 [Planctomycetota bacterium]|nr:hypothetical protein [Planctomycetota bacterium]
MGSISRAAALAAAALVGLQTADAGFVYSTSNRVVSAVVPSSSDTKSTSLFGNWFGSAFVSGAGVSSLANQGSDLGSTSISLVGASQAIGAAGASAIGESTLDATFVAMSDDGAATLDVNWMIGLSQTIGGVGSSTVFIKLTDVTLNTVRLVLSSSANASDTLTLVSGNTYRLEALASSSATGAGNAFSSFNGSFSIVPGPASAALLALAGAVGKRRRRR